MTSDMNDIARIYYDQIVRAVIGKSTCVIADAAALERICEHLADCEEAGEIMTVKGWRKPGMSPVEVAKAVPENVRQKLKQLFRSE